MRPLIVHLHIKLKMCTDLGQSMGPGLGWERKPGASTLIFSSLFNWMIILDDVWMIYGSNLHKPRKR